jgi:tRNA pseudouridine38-40 synthase
MPRYFLEVFYKGTNYSGFQTQRNANTVQAEVEKAMNTFFHIPFTGSEVDGGVKLTAASRTDAGVHALQNYFHFDFDREIQPQFVYKVNAILPDDIVIRKLLPVQPDAHCRFDAISREYKYFIYGHKDPFLKDRAYYFPYRLDIEKLNRAAAVIREYDDFTSFSKRKTQVRTFNCQISESRWIREENCLIYHVKANRFLRGMVRGLTATMLKIGRGKMSLDELHAVIRARDCTRATFSVPSRGLFLVAVEYLPGYFE